MQDHIRNFWELSTQAAFLASPPSQAEAACQSGQHLRTYKSLELLLILGSTRITRHQECLVGLEVPAALRFVTWG